MDTRPETNRPAAAETLSFAEFVGIVALMMGLTALSIDFLLPAFPPVADSYGITDTNQLQWLVYSYMIGFAVMQLVYGPLSDIVGRRPAVIGGTLVFAAGCVLALFAPSFAVLIAGRVVQGMGAAAARVLAVSIVRDRFGGRDMARVMSFVMMIFIIVPIFAPALGGVVLAFADWHMIFAVMLGLGAVLLIWFGLRMPETLHPDYRMPFSVRRIGDAAVRTITNRTAFGYSTGMALMSGCLMGYIGSAQQIFETEVYALGSWFPLAFALVAGAMGVASFLNSRFVPRFGMRRIAHGALVGYVGVALLQVLSAVATGGHPPLVLFLVLMAANNFLFSLILPNFNALSMEPLGAVAGTASSLIGFYTTLGGALLGLAVGQSFDGTVTPLVTGFLVLSIATLAVTLWTEKGRLFQAQTPLPPGR
ncbi:multidrug effflux MFS transporter [Chthonobacter rhizosphaerae]|uniref:multidrug effflux MFS transporter n=1 Tax=Chthonobacter rhizosphaerae TaxID=2735553 RepID=UPI0015EEFBBB|nr:multidrug effflux MFS transporter [Chthonobacter rhizosphaerae]